MNTTPVRVPVTHLEDPEADMPKRPALAKLTPKNRVRLLLNLMAFDEACGWFADTIQALGVELQASPWQATKDLALASQVYLLLDIYHSQMEAHALGYPEQVKLTISRAEAGLLWRTWYERGLEPSKAAAFTDVMHTLHQLLA